LIAGPLSVLILLFVVSTILIWPITIPLVFALISVGVGLCFALSRALPNAHVVGVGLLLSMLPTLLIGLAAFSGIYGGN